MILDLDFLMNYCFFRIRGIPFISKDVKKRFSYIAKELATGKYDIVCLQEVL